MSTFDIGSPVWKQAAKKYWRKDYYDVNRMDLEELDATATRRLRSLLAWKQAAKKWYSESIHANDLA